MSDDQENPTKKTGLTMMILAWVVILALAISFFAEQEQSHYNPNIDPDSKQTASENVVILERNKYHHYVTNGQINQQVVTFLLDTGASDVVIPERIAKQLGLTRGAPHAAYTANGVIEVYSTRLKQLTIGSITLYDVDASINPSMGDKSILLGMSALKDIEFTQRGDQLTLKQYR